MDHSAERFAFLFQERVVGLAVVGDANRPAEDDHAADLVEVRRHLGPLLEAAEVNRDAEVAKDRPDAAEPFGFDVL
jgi:hypothetical protein